jgi:hypothetical protein
MAALDRLPYREVWATDFEFCAPPGERPTPVCVVAWELKSGRRLKLWRDHFGSQPPYAIDAGALFVAYYVSAELGCHQALGWPMPVRILDLYAEFRARTNGLPLPVGPDKKKHSLLCALVYFGLDHINASEKDEMRALIMHGDSWSSEERSAILDYCESDVESLSRLLPAMLPRIDLPRALLRGRFMAAAAAMEHVGTPIDVRTLDRLQTNWETIQGELIRAIDADYSIYENLTFKYGRFEAFLRGHNIPWPRLPTGNLDLESDTFREMGRIYPTIAPLHELRSTLGELRLHKLAVGQDGRNRCILSAFQARTSRNQPSSSRFIFGPSTWIRCLIQPPPGYGVAYIDWEQQEFGIAAALSGDTAMVEAYESGDPYLDLAKRAGAAPPDATRNTHAIVRERYKACVLGVQYGMGWRTLAFRLDQPPFVARDLLDDHRRIFRTFWQWSDRAVDSAMLTNCLTTTFGWPIHISNEVNARSLRNYPMQGNGAEMLRLACCLATERGVPVSAPVHDAVLITAPLTELDCEVERMRDCMAEASRAVLAGFALRTEAKVVRYPDRYSDPRGTVMWQRVQELLAKAEARLKEHAA